MTQAARIPEFYWNKSIQDIPGDTPSRKKTKNELLVLAKNLKSEEPTIGSVFITGKPHVVRAVGYLLLKAALFRYRGITCGLDELTTWFLSQDKVAFNTVREVPVLNLFFGEEYVQQVHKYLLNHVITFRKDPRFITIYTTSVTQMGMSKLYDINVGDDGAWVKLGEDAQL